MINGLTPKDSILIVYDDENFLHSLFMKLKSEGITNVEKCQDSLNVMPRLKEKKYSLIYLDVIMPVIRGEYLLPEILSIYPDMYVIMLTAVEEVGIAVRCMKMGAKYYMSKTDL